MHKQLWVLLVVFAVGGHTSAWAQDSTEEIVVTGSRIGGYTDITKPIIPVVHLKRRADFVVISTYIESDSRDRQTREREVNATLKSLRQQAGRTENIELGLTKTFETEDDEINYVVPFQMDSVDMTSGYRPDTSRVWFLIKSPILDSDQTPDQIAERVENFVDSVKVTGRAAISDDGDANLSIVNIAQYRQPLLQKIAADTAKTREIFGNSFKIAVSGLEEPIRWQVVGPMQLAIYFPYYSSVSQ